MTIIQSIVPLVGGPGDGADVKVTNLTLRLYWKGAFYSPNHNRTAWIHDPE